MKPFQWSVQHVRCVFVWLLHIVLLQSQAPFCIEWCISNTHYRPPQSLHPVDEFFLFLMYLAAGLKNKDQANRFSAHQSTVSRIISTWTNFLYTFLGSVGIWIEKEDVRANLPEVFQDFPDTQFIVDCTQLKCQMPSSLLLQIKFQVSLHHEGTDWDGPPWCNNLCVSLGWGVY